MPKNCVISSVVGKPEFAIIDTEIYVRVITLSTEDNIKLLKQLESGFKRAEQIQNICLDFLINPSFHGVNRLFPLSLENKDDRNAQTGYFPPKEEIKDCNVVIDGKLSLISQ